MRIIVVVVSVAIAIVAVSGCAPLGPQLYSPYPGLPPSPELYGSPYPDSPPSPELYGGAYPNGYSYAYDYYGGPYRDGYPGYWASGSSVCWDQGRRIPCNPGP